MNKPRKLPSFIHHCMTIGELPTSYKISLTYEEQLMWFCNFLENEVIPVVNNNSTVVQELLNWFDNLDVQDEVDNKLEEMAESGELAEIIAQYLDLQGILAYNTASALEAAQNLAEGSFARIYGKLTYNDGLGAFYKIRQLLNTDVIDGDNLIALTNYPTLVAEKMPDAYITGLDNKIGNLTNLTTTTKTNAVAAINEVNANVDAAKAIERIHTLKNKKVIVMGDSLCITGRWRNILCNLFRCRC